MRHYLWIAAALSAPVMAEDAPRIAPPGAWVEPMPAATRPAGEAPSAEAPLVVLRFDQQLRFGHDADERYFASAVKIQTAAGLAPMGTIALPWNPESSSITVHALHIVRGGQTIDVLAGDVLAGGGLAGGGLAGARKFTVLRREAKLESAVLDGVLTATIQLEGLQVGDIVETAYTTRFRDPALRAHSEGGAEIPANLTGTQARVLASWPADLAMNWRKSEAMPAIRTWKDKAGTHLAVSLRGTGTQAVPKGAPARYAAVQTLELSDYPSWAELSAALAPLYVTAATLPPGSPLLAEVARIRAASADPKMRAGLALKLVQEGVRYVYQGMNNGNLVPAAAADTWSRRFGDCKGKTALLLALLHALDITAEPAMVSSTQGDGLDRRLPLAALFDHILVRAEIAGTSYWLDGTRPGDGPLDEIVVPAFHWALPLRPAGATLVPLLPKPLAAPSTLTSVAIDASKGIAAPAPVTVTTLLRGDDARVINLQLTALSGGALDEALKKYWKAQYSFITPDKVAARYDPARAEETLTMSGIAKLGWTASDYGYQLDGAGLGFTPDYARDSGPGTGSGADAPVAVTYPYYVANHETIRLPQGGRGFTIDVKDIDTTLAGYRFQRKTGIAGGVLTMDASTRALVPEIPIAQAQAAVAELTRLNKERVYVKTPSGYSETAGERAAMQAETPMDAKGFVARGVVFMDSGAWDKAIADFDKAIALDPDNALALADRGIVRAWKGEEDKALDDLDKAAAINPRLPQVFDGRAVVLTRQGAFGAAIAALTRAIDLQKDNPWALYQRARLYSLIGNHAAALADADAVVKLQPQAGSALSLRIAVQTAAGRYADALGTIEALAQAVPTPDADGLAVERGYLLARMGKRDIAHSLFAGVRGNVAKNAEALNNLCWRQAQADFELPAALADCDEALKLSPDTPAYLDSAGLVLLRLGRYDEAIARYDRALAKQPGMAPSLYGRGIAKLRRGLKPAGDADIAAAQAATATVAAEFAEFGVKP